MNFFIFGLFSGSKYNNNNDDDDDDGSVNDRYKFDKITRWYSVGNE